MSSRERIFAVVCGARRACASRRDPRRSYNPKYYDIIVFARADGRPCKSVRRHRYQHHGIAIIVTERTAISIPEDTRRLYLYLAVSLSKSLRSCHGNRIENVNPLNQYYTDDDT